MKKRRLIWYLYPSYLLLVLAALAAVTWAATRSLEQFYRQSIRHDLESQAVLAEQWFGLLLAAGDYKTLDALCKELHSVLETRLTVILPSGRVIADSLEKPELMENHLDRPEIRAAIQGRTASFEHFSTTRNEPMMYLARPVIRQEKLAAVVRTALPTSAIQKALSAIYRRILYAGVLTAAGLALLSLLMARHLSRPLGMMRQAARQFARGRLEQRMAIPPTEELAALAESLNEMAGELQQRIQTITSQRNELEAILSSMAEGVIAIDLSGRIVNINQAAIRLLNIAEASQPGRPVEEVVRNSEFQSFVEQVLQTEEGVENEIHLYTFKERYLRLQGASLHNARGDKSGAVIVINDMTRVRQLETIRREFVANVSHELKTPVTSIKGFVETLQEGALRDPQQAEHFLQIIGRHTDRLQAIIEDLLSLSWLENQGEERALHFPVEKLQPILTEVLELMAPKAEKQQIEMELSCEEGLEARVNPALLEQALLNLVDNAIKYSPEQGKIRIEANRAADGIEISVQDHGCGIAAKHLERIFERFYVVDKARSRKLGGTGLGLSIVKHIAQIHGGRVTVASTLGEGSTFTIHLPNPKP